MRDRRAILGQRKRAPPWGQHEHRRWMTARRSSPSRGDTVLKGSASPSSRGSALARGGMVGAPPGGGCRTRLSITLPKLRGPDLGEGFDRVEHTRRSPEEV